jgi:acyl-CoA thioesterase
MSVEPRRIDVARATAAFEHAVAEHSQEFGKFFLAKLYGFEITFPEKECEVAFEALDFMFNPQGTLHGGVIATALDVSMGHLLRRAAGPGTTLEFKVQFLSAIKGGKVRCRGRIMRLGKSLAFLSSEALDADGQAAAFATSTWKLLGSK